MDSARLLPVSDESATRKAELIRDALATVRAAHDLDERDELVDLDAASFVAWYDRTIPQVRDIKILAGAMEIELARRRGERVLQEGEQRGRPEKLTQRVSLIPREHMQRSRDRAIAAEPEAVTAYVRREATAGKVPTLRGAVRVANTARATAAPQRIAKQAAAMQARQSELDEQMFALIRRLADGTRRTDDQVAKLTGYQTASFFLQRIRLIPWLHIDRTPMGLLFQIDEELRAICTGRLPRPTLSYRSIEDFLRTLRAEITRKRKENRDERRKSRWDSTLILTRVQSNLLDWIEEQLDRVPPL